MPIQIFPARPISAVLYPPLPLPITTTRLSLSSLSPPIAPPLQSPNPAPDQVTGRGLAVRSRDAGRASLATAALLLPLSAAALLRLSVRLWDTKKGDRQTARSGQHESAGAGGGTRQTLSGLVQTRTGPTVFWSFSRRSTPRTRFGAPRMCALDFTQRREPRPVAEGRTLSRR